MYANRLIEMKTSSANLGYQMGRHFKHYSSVRYILQYLSRFVILFYFHLGSMYQDILFFMFVSGINIILAENKYI